MGTGGCQGDTGGCPGDTGGHRWVLSPHSQQQVQELEAQRARAQRELLEAREALSRALLEAELARDEQEALAEALGKVGIRACRTAGLGTDTGVFLWVQVHPYGCIPTTKPQLPPVPPVFSMPPIPCARRCPQAPGGPMPPVLPNPQVPPVSPLPQVLPKPQSHPSCCASGAGASRCPVAGTGQLRGAGGGPAGSGGGGVAAAGRAGQD